MVPADSDRVSRAPPYSGYFPKIINFNLPDYHRLWSSFPAEFNYLIIFWLCARYADLTESPTTPSTQRLQTITCRKFRLFPFRSPLLGKSLVYFLFVLLLRCFSSQAFPPYPIDSDMDHQTLLWWSFLIRIPTDQGLLATPRRVSPLYASFIGC